MVWIQYISLGRNPGYILVCNTYCIGLFIFVCSCREVTAYSQIG
jgi:hypothetical protein